MRTFPLFLLVACAGSPVQGAKVASGVPGHLQANRGGASLARPVAAGVPFGSEDPESQGGTWVPPELRELVARLDGTAARPTRVMWLFGTAAPGCKELWRFRILYGAADRFANLSGFRSAAAAEACAAAFRASHGGSLREQRGPFFLSFTGTLAGEDALRAGLTRAVASLGRDAATPVPETAVPAGARADFVRHPRVPPPPKHHAGLPPNP